MKALASGDRRVPLEVLTILGSIVAAISFVGILLAWIQSSGISVVGGLIGVFVGFGLIFRGHFSRNSDTAPVASSPLFDEASLHAFDQMLEKAAIVVPDDIALQLNKIKQLFIRISRQSNGGECDEHFTMDDRMYLIECLRRYLPDSLESYLLIPEQQRKIVAIDGHQTAAMVLGNQLSLILTELEKSESKIVKTAAGKLLRQQRFLESKRS